ncbi:MAG: C40 family peptidase [Ignavibacteria bacterium]|nr:C40 family peptidase [Ignavibacteria bacterium]
MNGKLIRTLVFALTCCSILGSCRTAVRFASETRVKEVQEIKSSSHLDGKRKALLKEIERWLGVPYCFGGTSLNCVDCSGFVMNLYKSIGIKIPRTAEEQAQMGKTISLENLAVGDLLFFGNGRNITHVAISIGGWDIVHSATSRGVVCEKLSYALIKDFKFAKRVLE